jgi:hypothetical protein
LVCTTPTVTTSGPAGLPWGLSDTTGLLVAAAPNVRKGVGATVRIR